LTIYKQEILNKYRPQKLPLRVIGGKPEGKRPLGRPRRIWEDGIRMDLGEIGWGRRVDPVGFG
jgi:hypothetical protein